jgi:predicted adenylyl cyclase CyaB
MRNLEAKFHLDNIDSARCSAIAIGFAARATIRQRDTFFRVSNGKLKLREESDRAALIHYRRAPAGALELSDYTIVPVADPAAMRAIFADALGVLAEVRKSRELLTRRNVRLHLDRVDGLGDFGEIEAVLEEGEAAELYRAEVAEILAALGIPERELIDASYFELTQRA